MTITRVTAGSQASIDDLNQLIELLEGTSGYELAFLLRCIASSDFTIRLADAAGAREFIIQDSGGNSAPCCRRSWQSWPSCASASVTWFDSARL